MHFQPEGMLRKIRNLDCWVKGSQGGLVQFFPEWPAAWCNSCPSGPSARSASASRKGESISPVVCEPEYGSPNRSEFGFTQIYCIRAHITNLPRLSVFLGFTRLKTFSLLLRFSFKCVHIGLGGVFAKLK